MPASTKKRSSRRWSAKVKTDSTHPPKGLFNKPAATIARTMARKAVSPKGRGSGVRMIQFYINRAGKNLTAAQKRRLEHAKHILQNRRKRRR